jgi:predicted RNase H-like nuclease (RuvC/YqgF family)
MPTTTKPTSALDRLTSLGEDVLGKASQNPTASKFIQQGMQLKAKVDDLSKRVRGLEGMEKKINQLEKRIAKLESAAKKSAAGSTKKTTIPPPASS